MAKRYCLPFSLAITIALSACVGRGRYLETLLSQEAALSEAAAARSDLEDAALRYAALREEFATLQASYRAERDRAYEEQSGSLTERQQLLRERAVQGLVIDSLRRVIAKLDAKRSTALAVVDRRDERLRELRARVLARSGNFLPGQFELREGDHALVLGLAAGAIFETTRRGGRPRISEMGDASLANLAGALGGRTDILIDVVCEVERGDDADAGLAAASRRAGLVVDNLVVGHGLTPEIVRAVGARSAYPHRPDAATVGSLDASSDASGGDPAARISVVVYLQGAPLSSIGDALR